jgi:hypothetical protein
MQPGERHQARPWSLDDEDGLSVEELLGPDGPAPGGVREQARHLLGIGPERVTYREPYPGVRELREDLGL